MEKYVELKERVGELNKILEKENAEFVVMYDKVFKPNIEKDALLLRSDNFNCTPTVYPDEELLAKSDFELAQYLQAYYKEHSYNLDVKQYLNKDYILKTVLPRLCSKSNCTKLAARDIVYIPFLDMLVYFYVPVNDLEFKDENGVASFKLSENILEETDLTLVEVYNAAIANITNCYTIRNMQTIIAEMTPPELMEEIDEFALPIYILSNESSVNGAAAMLSEKALNEIVCKLQSDEFVIIPSSIHECICIPHTDEKEVYTSMVKEANDNVVMPEEVLSYTVYLYKKGRITIL